jgi:ABC-2 type transport system permease protein
MKAFFYHLAYEFRATLRDKSLLLMTYLFPLFFFVMMGLLMTKANPVFVNTMIPAMILVAVMSSMLMGMPSPLVSARETGIFRSYKINGVPSLSILIIPVIASILNMIVISVIIAVAGYLFFDAVLPTNWGLFVLIWIVVLISYAGLGALIGTAAPNSRAVVLLAQLVFVPSMILGGLMMPVSMLPASLAKIANLLPTTHAMAAFNQLAYQQHGATGGWTSLVVLLVSGIASFGLAVFLFEWDPTLKRRHPAWLAILALVPYMITLLG